MRKLVCLFMMIALCWAGSVKAQMPGGVPVTVSGVKQMINGQCFYIHIVQRGQTIYSITKAYGLKEYDAVYRKSARLIDIGDTVWLPCRGLDNKPKENSTVATTPTDEPVAVVKQEEKRQDADTPKPNREERRQTTVKSETPSPVVHRDTVATRVAAADEQQTGRSSIVSRELAPHSNLVISLMMPLYLDQMGAISTEGVASNGGHQPKPFEFLQFYEGIMLALHRMEQQGIGVTLNVIDVPDENPETVAKLFDSYNVAQSHLLIALLTRAPFAKAAELAKQNNLFVVNPIATRNEILKDNPYLFKCRPSQRSRLITIMQTIRATMPSSHLVIVHSGGEKDKNLVRMATNILEERGDINYTFLDWSNSGRLQSILNNHQHTVVLSLYNVSQSRNRIYASTLLNKLSAYKNNPATLITLDDWTQMFNDIDFNQLQQLSYHTFYEGWCQTDEVQQAFFTEFRNEYKVIPTMQYAAMGNDIATYFVTGLYERGAAFWEAPSVGIVPGMVTQMSFIRRDPSMGYENQSPCLYRMEDFSFKAVR